MATTPQDLDSGTPVEGRFAPAQIALAVLGVLLLLLLIWFFFLRADDTATETATPVVPAPAATEDEAEESLPPRKSPVETFEVFAPKDPFDPLISAATGGGTGTTTGATGTSTTDGTTTTSTTDGTTTDGTGTTTTTTTTSGGGDGGEDVGGHRVRVIDVFRSNGGGRAQIQVDGTVYTVDEGERFADNFELLSTSGSCATILFGDDQFTLCEGEEILK